MKLQSFSKMYVCYRFANLIQILPLNFANTQEKNILLNVYQTTFLNI